MRENAIGRGSFCRVLTSAGQLIHYGLFKSKYLFYKDDAKVIQKCKALLLEHLDENNILSLKVPDNIRQYEENLRRQYEAEHPGWEEEVPIYDEQLASRTVHSMAYSAADVLPEWILDILTRIYELVNPPNTKPSERSCAEALLDLHTDTAD